MDNKSKRPPIPRKDRKALVATSYPDLIEGVIFHSIQKASGVQAALERIDRNIAKRKKGQRTVENWEEERAAIANQTGDMISIDLFVSLTRILVPATLHDAVISKHLDKVFKPSKTQNRAVRPKNLD